MLHVVAADATSAASISHSFASLEVLLPVEASFAI
jgi:hypothetical protein